VTERKMGNKHLLEADKLYICKGGRGGRKVTERKMGNKHLLEACKDKHVNVRRARKVTERKICNTHLLEAWEAIFKCEKNGGKKGEKGEK
jgi:hypothetical protein